MLFEDIIDQETIKKQLFSSADKGRIPHAQLFVAPKGAGALPLAIAYAQYILCKNTNGENNTGDDACNLKFKNFAHPDLHFAFPVATTSKVKSHAVSDLFMEEWRNFLNEQPYGDELSWYSHLGIENKQGQIGVAEAETIVKKLSLKSYEGGFKVMIIWMAERMNVAAANKLLKLIEEPPKQTLLLLITENEEQIINTILSRCQKINLQKLSEESIVNALIKRKNIDVNIAKNIAHQANGNWNKSLQILTHSAQDEEFEKWFVTWVRTAFKAKGNVGVIEDLVKWSEGIAANGREIQKSFLAYCLQFFRQALLKNYGADNLVFLVPQSPNFDLDKFAPYIHSANIMEINHELNEAIYHIERNGNAKIILLDLSLKLTRLLHKKEEA